MKSHLANKRSIRIDSMSFYWRVKNSPKESNIVPSMLPFELTYNVKLKLVVQKKNQLVLKALETIYEQPPNIGNIQEYSPFSKSYMDDFLRFLIKYIPDQSPDINILEIGCGGCLLLKYLQDLNYNVFGIDPSPFSLISGKKVGVEVVKDFFPSNKITQKFDVIYHSDVLEHVKSPLKFLRSIHRQLKDDGMLILAVPDSGPSLDNGDISLLLHQHLNYFTEDSLWWTIQAAGFDSIVINKAKYGGSLYCKAKKNKSGTLLKTYSNNTKIKYGSYIHKAMLLADTMKSEINNILSDKRRSLGFYAPVRALPYLSLWKLRDGFRLFDDTTYWHRKYLDGMDIPIENFEDLQNNPVTDIFIMSPTFGEVIERRIKKSFGKKIHTVKLVDFFHT